ncbi:CDK5RAP2 [Lepeophtheirus salmonis]|uniref:CDK5RAP2 n=1 Tax=Lepeophtheirus salmonis TaxID=72036 RepID=A0A7R8H8Z3_LEPSM|nr:CDK5RAP2 [Lepeophtheirus salmonis]CAF2946760.1 CDK5RAP2 [Lepeophtheirus salmonis]
MSSSFSYDPSLPLTDGSVLPEDRAEVILSGSGADSHLVPSVSTGSSICTMREYEDELSFFKRENLNLKLRIYMMEDSYGFHTSGDDQKKAHKLNVDLRVENEELKKELSDKKDLLGEAYSALSNFEEVSTKAQTTEHSKRLTKGGADLDIGVDLLEDAFGTLSEEDSPFQVDKMEELLKNILIIIFEDEIKPGNIHNVDDKNGNDNEDQQLSEITHLIQGISKDVSNSPGCQPFQFELSADLVQNVKNVRKDELELEKKSNERLETNLSAKNKSNKQFEIEVDTKLKEILVLTKESEAKSEKLTKSYEFCQSLTKALAEQKGHVEKLKKDVKNRDTIVKKLTDEYNDLKAKVRAKVDVAQNNKNDLEESKKQRHVISNTQDIHDVVQKLSIIKSKEICDKIKEYRSLYIRQGCNYAMQCYQNRMKGIQKDVSSAVKLMRGRLEELAEFLQRVLESNESNEIERRMSKDFLQSLQTSLNETRRFSTSLLNESSILNESLQLGENIMDEIESAFSVKNKSIESILSECDLLKGELSNDDMDFLENIQKEIIEKVICIIVPGNSAEVNELKSSLEEERLLVEKMSQIQLELKKQIDITKDESELKSEELNRIYKEVNAKSLRLKLVEEQINSLSKQVKEFEDREGHIKSSYLEDIQNLKSELSESASSKLHLQNELESLQEEKNKIIECCSENENLKDQLRKN